MKKRTSSMSRRVVSLLMSLVLTLTLVTPAAFATEVVDCSGTPIVEGDTNPADPAPGEDSENNEDKNTEDEDGKDEQPTEPGDEDKNPDEDNGDDASKPDGAPRKLLDATTIHVLQWRSKIPLIAGLVETHHAFALSQA